MVFAFTIAAASFKPHNSSPRGHANAREGETVTIAFGSPRPLMTGYATPCVVFQRHYYRRRSMRVVVGESRPALTDGHRRTRVPRAEAESADSSLGTGKSTSQE